MRIEKACVLARILLLYAKRADRAGQAKPEAGGCNPPRPPSDRSHRPAARYRKFKNIRSERTRFLFSTKYDFETNWRILTPSSSSSPYSKGYRSGRARAADVALRSRRMQRRAGGGRRVNAGHATLGSRTFVERARPALPPAPPPDPRPSPRVLPTFGSVSEIVPIGNSRLATFKYSGQKRSSGLPVQPTVVMLFEFLYVCLYVFFHFSTE
ncbi:hypothetical protein EVAR_95211_1 [Eumeta japonica]|uniref:Uncharacterized protein n=1 Tax=Eumeta variegata TaxID=151549 RepID=A0A4C1VJJ0_EUMVA|nr:hypothetical protein EVAR_95211_1 [Eumeta japonica]